MVILYNPTSSANRKAVLPLSLLALASLLEGAVEYSILDGNLLADPFKALDRCVREHKVRILGLTVMPGPQLENSIFVSRELKRLHPELQIVWGGYFPSQHWETVVASPYVDFVVRGYAETSFIQLVTALEKGDDYRQIPGLSYSRDGELRSNPVPQVPDPGDFPEFPYRRLPMGRYLRNTFMGKTLSHHSSYGCPFRCNFCAVVNLSQGRWKAQSASRVARTVRTLQEEWGAGAIEFFDNNFFVDEGRVCEFADRIKTLSVRWWAEGRVDTLLRFSQSTWQILRQSGLTMVFLGAESASDTTLQKMNKGGQLSPEMTLELAARMKAHRIIPEFSFVVGNPPDPASDTEKTLGFVRQVKAVNPESEIIFYLYTPVPLSGTLYESARNFGFAFPDSLEEWTSLQWREFSLRRSGSLPWVDRSVVRRIRDFEKVLNAYYPTSTDPSLVGARRLLLRASGSWRYWLGLQSFPLELTLLQRLFHYQRPETSGF